MDIYLATVCLDRNRWGSRKPSFEVSRWISRFEKDGFDGVELWEFHYLEAGLAEQERLVDAAYVAVYNSYVGFADADVEARQQAATAIAALRPASVKYNLGADPSKLAEYRRNLLQWSDALPADCRLMCECHSGTVLEAVDEAVAFFSDLDADRFGVIAHVNGESRGASPWLDAFGSRVGHLHVQLRQPDFDPGDAGGRQGVDEAFGCVVAAGFNGSVSVEFTRGIGRDEDIENLYANACADLGYLRMILAR